MKIEVPINFNESVEVTLTEYGYKIYSDDCIKYNGIPKPKTNMKFQFQLWEIMQIFGPLTHMGGQQMFKNNEFRMIHEVKIGD